MLLRVAASTSLCLIAFQFALPLRSDAALVGAFIGGNSFYGTASLSGTLDLSGNGAAFNPIAGAVQPLSFTDPTSHQLVPTDSSIFYGASSVSSSNEITVDMTLSAITDIPDLNVTAFLNAPFEFNRLFVTTSSSITVLKNIPVDIVGKLQNVNFLQTGAATFHPISEGKGAFAIPGDFLLRASSMHAYIHEIIDFHLGTVDAVTPTVLQGRYSIEGSADHPELLLSGSYSVPFALSVAIDFSYNGAAPIAISLSPSASIVANASLTGNYAFRLFTSPVPEPGSIVLFGIGLASTGALALHRRKLRTANTSR